MSQPLAAGAASYCDALLQLKELLQELRPAVTEAVQATAAAGQQTQKRRQQQRGLGQQKQGEQQPTQGKAIQKGGEGGAAEREKEEEEDGRETEVLRPLDVAQLQLCLAFATVSLYHSYLKTQGQDVETHPVVRDLARVRAYMKKVAARVEEDRRGGALAVRSVSVNVAAAKRLLQFYTRRPATR